jgi:hypothetical protein
VFGQENLTHLLDDKQFIPNMKKNSKKGVYGLVDMIRDVCCDIDNPQNNTIIKPDKHGEGIYIMCDDNRWEYRELEDVRDDLIVILSKVFEKFSERINNLGIKFSDVRERNYMRSLVYYALCIGTEIHEDLYDALDLDDSKIEELIEDENKTNAKRKKFDNVTKRNLYEYACRYYQEKEGTYTRKPIVKQLVKT